MKKKLTALFLAVLFLLPSVSGALAETEEPAQENAANEVTFIDSETVYTITENGEIVAVDEAVLTAPLESALTGDSGQDALTGQQLDNTGLPDLSTVSGQGQVPGGGLSGGSLSGSGPVQQLTIQDIQAMNPDSEVIAVFGNDGYLSTLLGKYYDQPVLDQEDGIKSIQGIAGMLGLTKGSEFYAVYKTKNRMGYTFYTYQQRYGQYTLRYASLRIIVDPQGYVMGLSCSFTPNVGMASHEPRITADEALAIVQKKYTGVDLKYYPENTVREAAVFHNAVFDCYVIYTSNPGATVSFDMPYLEHFVTILGEYVCSIPTNTFTVDRNNIMDNSPYFEGFEMQEYTRTMTLEDGSVRTVTVPVGYNPNDGLYYLIDPERKIAVADYYDFNYANKVTFVTSETVDGWSQNNLMAYANFAVIYDFYAAHGISSIDGFGTPILITVSWVNENHEPEDNAVFYGVNRGWACFGISDINHYGDCVDVVGHEYTHGVLRQSVQGVLSINETGAINEAYSDIMGNLAEMSLGYTEDRTWQMAEKTGDHIRDMSNPNSRQQPEYVGDVYYQSPVVTTDSLINDNGGVHKNNSLLGHIAYLMDQSGMTYDQQISMWLTINEILTPQSDYTDLHAALLLSLKINGLMQEYGKALNDAFTAAGLDDDWSESYLTATREGYGRVTFEPMEELKDFCGQVLFYDVTQNYKYIDAANPDPEGRVSALLPPGIYVAQLFTMNNSGKFQYYNFTGTDWVDSGNLKSFTVKANQVTNVSYTPEPAKEYGEVTLRQYDGGYFSMLVPEGWDLEVGGEYTSFSFRISDPDNPSTEVFYYGNLLPFHKSEVTRSYWASVDATAGLGPILTSPDVIGILNCWNYTISFMQACGFTPEFPALYNMECLGGGYFQSSYYSGLAYSESACLITCDTEWDSDCKLTVTGTLVDYDKENTYGGNMFFNVINLTGVLAPEDRYDEVFDVLLQCVTSLTFTDAYIEEARQHLEFMASNADRTSYLIYLTNIMKNCYTSNDQ